jgi:hypothetical protein
VKLSAREQIIALVAGVLVLFIVVYRFLGLGEMLSRLSIERERLATLRSRAEQYRLQLNHYPDVAARYERYANYSLRGETQQDPADEFTVYVNNVLRGISTDRVPTIHPTEEEDIPGVPNYIQILLPVDTSMNLDSLIDLLRTFDRERLLIRRLEVHQPIDSGPTMTVNLTLSRFVRVNTAEATAGEASPEAGRAGR